MGVNGPSLAVPMVMAMGVPLAARNPGTAAGEKAKLLPIMAPRTRIWRSMFLRLKRKIQRYAPCSYFSMRSGFNHRQKLRTTVQVELGPECSSAANDKQKAK
mmetsp:Transcript_38006/g.59278  ORF Transcript_38006/g.59278 Transcript_38006/m.59278 type:complete len:102 (+) Transcript_38006:494-799(+)